VTADLETRDVSPADGRKIKGTIHWLSAKYALSADVMLYEKLFTQPNLGDIPEDSDFTDFVNRDSLQKLTGAKLEPSIAESRPGDRFQFVRIGYFCKDTKNANTFNRIVTLKDGYKA
jgi:glutaminyl-tRNA synthetase